MSCSHPHLSPVHFPISSGAMNVLQSSDTHLLFGKGLTWYKDCPKPALGHALQQHLSKPESNLGLRDTCSPQAATLQLISDGLGSFQPFKKHTSRLQAPSNCECLFIEHSQGAVSQLIVLPILPRVFSTRPAACPRVLLAVPSIHITCTHLSFPLRLE